MLLIPLYVTVLPRHLDGAARRAVRVIEDDPARAYLIRLVVLHSQIARAAAATEIPELDHAARLGHRVLWDAAGLLEGRAPWPHCDARLHAYEDLCTALAQQASEAAAAQQDLDAAVVGRGDVDDVHLDGAEESAAAQDEALLSLQALAEASTALDELTASHRYAASRLNSLTRFQGRR